jgi:hypothetical protein
MDDRERQFLAAAPVGDGAIASLEIAVDLCSIPSLGVTGVAEPEIILLGPKERHLVEPLALAQNVAGRNLSLPLCHDPVLDADIVAGQSVRQVGTIMRADRAEGEYVIASAGLQHGLAAHVTGEHMSVRKICECDTLSEAWVLRRRAHSRSLHWLGPRVTAQ